MKNGLQLRITLGTIALLLFITVSVAGVAVYTTRISLEESARRDAEQRHEGITQMIEMYERHAQAQANTLAQHPLIVEAVENHNARDLLGITTPIMQKGKLDYLVFTDSQGFVIARTHESGKTVDPAERIADQEHIAKALQGKSSAGLGEDKDAKLSVRAGAPLYDSSGILIGTVSTGYAISKDETVDKAKQMLGADFTLFLGNEVVATTLSNAEGKRMLGNILDNPVIERTVLQEGKPYHGFHSIDQVRYTAFYAPLTGANGKVIGLIYTGISTVDMEQLLAGLSKRIAAVSLAVCMLMLTVILLFTRAITRSLQILLGKVQEVSKGETGTAELEIPSRDEVGQLTDTVNGMLLNLQDLISQTACMTEQAAASSQQLTGIVGQMAAATGQIAASATQVEEGSAAQAQAVDSVHRAVEQMSGSIEEVVQKAKGTAATADKAADTVNEGGKAIDAVAGHISVIESRMTHSAQIVMRLGEYSQAMGQIVNKIAGMAGQTNALAFGAVLEAARAGEQGRGFVLAVEEVAKLAEQTQEATGQIAGLIGDMQAETRQAAGEMHEGTQAVKAGSDVLCEVGLTFGRTVDLVREVSEQVQAISAVLSQMAADRQQILSSLQHMEHIGNGTVDQARMVASSIEEQYAAIEKITASSQTLAKMAEELQSILRKFKI